MKKRTILLFCLILTISLFGCGKKENAKVEVDDKWKEEYSKIIDNVSEEKIGNIDNSKIENGKCKYEYAVSDIDKDKIPELFVQVTDENTGTTHGSVFTYKKGKVHKAKGKYFSGEGANGGYKGVISSAKSGRGFIEEHLVSYKGQGQRNRMILAETKDGYKLEKKQSESYSTFEKDQNAKEELKKDIGAPFKFFDINDKKGIEKYDYKVNGLADNQKRNKLEQNIDDKDNEADNVELGNGYYRLKGEFKVFDKEGLLSFQGINDPNPGSSDSEYFLVFVLDTPRSFEFRSTGADPIMFSHEINMFLIENSKSGIQEEWKEYENKKAVIIANLKTAHYPSDTRLPLGEPSLKDYEIQGE